METINPKVALLSNYEVLQVLQQLKDNQNRHNREESLATVTYETIHYLQDTYCKYQDPQKIKAFFEATKDCKLTKLEKLMMVNTPPRNELDVQYLVQEAEERLSEEDVQNILSIVNEHFPCT